MRPVLKRVLLGVAALVVLALAGAWWALHSEAVQRAALARLSAEMESRFGLTVEARALRFRPSSGRLELVGVEVSDADGGVLAGIESVRAEVRLSPLLGGRLEVPTLVLERPRIDLARLPRLTDDEAAAGPTSPPPIEIGELTIDGGELVGLPAPEPFGDWSWDGAIRAVELRAALKEGRLSAELTSARTSVARAGLGGMDLVLSGEISGPLTGPFELAAASARASELGVELAGSIGLAADQPLWVSFDARADVGALLDGGLAAPVTAVGEVDVRGSAGRLTLAAPALPAELGAAWLEPDLFSNLEAAGTTLAVAAELELGPGRLDRVRGSVSGSWRRGADELVAFELSPDVTGADGAARVPFDIRLAPAVAGRRRAEGVLSIPDLRAPAAAELADGRVDVWLPEIAESISGMGRLWPTLMASAPVGLRGAVELGGSISGRLEGPRLDLDASWRTAPTSAISVSASGRPLGGRVRLSVEAEDFELASVGTELNGRLAGRADLEIESGRRSGSFDLEASGLSAAGLDELRVTAAGDLGLGAMRFSRLTAEWPEYRVAAEARVGRSDDGLRIDVDRLVLNGVEGGATLDVPGALLAGLPAVSWLLETGEWRSAASRRRQLGLDWRLPASDLAGLLGVEGAALIVGTSGELVVDLERPSASSGEMRLSTLSWKAGERLAVLSEPVELRLTEGRLTADDVRIDAGESHVLAAVELGLDDRWRAGDPLDALIADARVESRGEIGAGWPGGAVESGLRADGPIAWGLELEGDRTGATGGFDLDAADAAIDGRGSATFVPEWTLAGSWLDLISELDVSAKGRLGAGRLGALGGAASADGALAIDLALAGRPGSLDGRVEIDGTNASWLFGEAESVRVEAPRIEARIEAGTLDLSRLEARVNGEPLAGTGVARLTGGRVEIDRLDVAFAGIESRWSGGLPVDGAGDLELEWAIAEADLGSALQLFGLVRPGDSIRAGSRGTLRLPPENPAAIDGAVEISGFDWVSGGIRTASEGPIRLETRDGRLRLQPMKLLSGLQIFDLSGGADLNESWRTGEDPLDLIGDLEIRGQGTLPASLIHLALAGAVAEGYLTLELEATGPPRDLRGRVKVEGSDARVTLARPYVARLSNPNVELTFESAGSLRLEGDLELNEGRVTLSGGGGDGAPRIRAQVEGARFRLDYGLLALVNANLVLRRDSPELWELSGNVEVRNGVLTRDVDLDLDLLAGLLAPVDLTSTEASALEAVALDLDLSTIEGVRVKNNLADLRVLWDPIRIDGTLAAPIIGGRFDVEPGGRVRALGQTVRIDSGSLDYPGVADLPATLELEITSSFEDPSIATLEGEDPFAGPSSGETDESGKLAAAATGLGSFLGERLTSGLSGASISLEPVLIYGEADPSARLTVSQGFSPQVSLAASIDLRSAEARTYLLDLHGLEAVPGLNAQVFTTDQASEGASLRQRLRLGAGGVAPATGPKIRKIHFDLPDGLSKRRLKRTLGMRKGDRMVDGGRFAAEVEVSESLRRRGYLDARVEVRERPVEGGIELEVSVRPGPRARFEFRGEKLSEPLRRSVADLYRSDYYEASALDEMKVETRRALRSLGFLDPSVEVGVEPLEPGRPESDRLVIVSMKGGERVAVERVRFAPLPADESVLLEARFSSPLRRTELAAGFEDADRRVEETLRYLGYAESRVAGRRLSDDGAELEVDLELGERPWVGTIELAGVEPEESQRLLALAGLEPGDPVRLDRVAGAALAIRGDLMSRGFDDARVEPRVVASAAVDGARDVRFDVDSGTLFFIGEVTFSGLAATRPSFAARVVGLDSETDFSQESLLEARRRLWSTRMFDTVTPEVVRAPGGAVRVDFGVRERQRFELAYGLRWDSEDDASALVEVIDRNTLGRGWTLGLRGRWAQNDQSLRAFAGLPRLFNERSSLGVFGLVREETASGLIDTTIEASVQLGYVLSQRLTLRLYGRLRDNHIREEIPANPALPFDQRFKRPILGSQLLYDTRNGPILSERGLLATADLGWSDASIGSDFDFARFFGQISYLKRLSGKSARPLTWAQSLRVGQAKAFGGQSVFRVERFFAGGEYSVRGYQRESLGPISRLGRPSGGDALLTVNQELRWLFAESFAAVLFVDGGNVWADRSDFGFDLLWSTGLGLRALTPVGLLRLDLAHALDRRPFDPEYKIYFGFGNTF